MDRPSLSGGQNIGPLFSSKYMNLLTIFKINIEVPEPQRDLLVPDDGSVCVLLPNHRLNRLRHRQLMIKHHELLVHG